MKYIKLYKTHLSSVIREDLSSAFRNNPHAVILCKDSNHLHYISGSLCVGCLSDSCCALCCTSSCCCALCCGERSVNYFVGNACPSLGGCIIRYINLDIERTLTISITFPYIDKINNTYVIPTIDGSTKRVEADSITLPSSVTFMGAEVRILLDFSSGVDSSSTTDSIIRIYDKDGNEFSYNYVTGCPSLLPYEYYELLDSCTGYYFCTG